MKHRQLDIKSFRKIKEMLEKHSMAYVANKAHRSTTTVFNIAHSSSFADYRRRFMSPKKTTHKFLFWEW